MDTGKRQGGSVEAEPRLEKNAMPGRRREDAVWLLLPGALLVAVLTELLPSLMLVDLRLPTLLK